MEIHPWDYLIVAASSERRAKACEAQLNVRRMPGLLSDIQEVIIVPDPGSKRVGSGGSAFYCLTEVLGQRR